MSPRSRMPLRGLVLAVSLAVSCAGALSAAGSPASAAPSVGSSATTLTTGLTTSGAVSAAVPAKAAPGRMTRASADGRRVRIADMPEVAAGGEFSCGVRDAGALWCWGRNTYGQLGLGRTGPGPVPPEQVGRATWTQVATGGASACGIRKDRALLCWGLNHRGQLGDGTTTSVSTPKVVRGTKDWTQVSTGWFHTCGVRATGTMSCWGDNSAGQLGRGDTQQTRALVRVPGTQWSTVTTAGWTTCATKRDGSLWCWGRNTFGQLGIGSMAGKASPTRVGTASNWKQVRTSWTHTCGVQRSGVAKCWGRNDQGQVGSGAPTYATKPATVPGEHVAASIAVSEGTSCLIDTAQAAWCWGDDRYGQASASATNTSTATPKALLSGRQFTSISGGWLHLCGETTSSGAICWGNNERGQLGSTEVPPPVAEPAPPTKERRAGALTVKMATMNALGNIHTRPGAHDDHFAPGRMRADWTAQSILNNGLQVVGLQEPDASQVAGIVAASDGVLASYPTPAAGDLGVESTLVWDTRYFEATRKMTIQTQFIARVLPRPVVRLREIATGRQFWVMAIHNAPQDLQAKRNKAVAVQLDKIRELEQTGLPVFYIGDFNEKATILCKVLRGTGLDSASGEGRLRANGECVTPKHMRVDWIFGSKAAEWSGYDETKTPLARLSTDHWVPVVNVRVP